MAKRRKLNRNPDHGRGLLKRLANQSANIPTSHDDAPQQYGVMDFDVTWDPLPDPVRDALPQATQDRLQEVFELVHRNPKSVIKELRDLVALHPDMPSLKNWLIQSLRVGTEADLREALELSQELFQQQPDYFFARTTLADLWLELGEIESAEGIEKAAALLFGPDCILTVLYPDRKVFHISEVRHWFYLCARVKICLGEPEIARRYRDILQELEPGSPTVVNLDAMLNQDSMTFRILSELKKTMTKRLR